MPSQHHWLTTLDAICTGVLILDVIGGHTMWSAGLQQRLQVRPDLPLARDLLQAVSPTDAVLIEDLATRLLQSKPGGDLPHDREVHQLRIRVLDEGRPGSGGCFDLAVCATRDADGRLEQVMVMFHDVTESERAARHSARLEALGRLAGGVAHDFANQLTAMLNNLHLIRHVLSGLQTPQADAVREYASELERSVGRAADTTAQLLEFSRVDPPPTATIDLCHVVRRTGLLLRRVVPATAQVDVHTAVGQVPIRVDRSRLEHALVNLVINAADASPRGGAITVTATRMAALPSGPGSIVAVPPASGDPQTVAAHGVAVLSVQDHGTGIDPAVVSQVFDPFFTTKPPGKGTGLGLAAVADTVRQAGGMVLIENDPGLGTRVDLVFPLLTGVATGEAAEPATATDSHGQIVVCDDDPATCESLARLLESSGFTVRSTTSPREAEDWIASGEPVDLFITDLVLGAVSGRELLVRARVHQPDLPVLVLSGYATESESNSPSTPDRVWFEGKPCPPARLLRRIQLIMDS